MRPLALALSPDRTLLVTSGITHELVVVDPGSGAIRQRVAIPDTGAKPRPDGDRSSDHVRRVNDDQIGFTGLVFSHDGRHVFLSNVLGAIEVFDVDASGIVTHARSIALPKARAPRRDEEIPAGLAVTGDDAHLLVCGNLSNRLLEIDLKSQTVTRTFDVGVAPFDVVLVQGKAYVSNWGGRRPGAGDPIGPAGRGTVVRVDPVRGIASEGSVSVVQLDPSAPDATPSKELVTGLHACALAASPDGNYVAVANAGSDTVSVIDAKHDLVVETILVKPRPSDLFGASPNALVFGAAGPGGDRLYVANGTQNAVAVVGFEPEERESRLLGLVPVGWFPGALALDPSRNEIFVANVKGLASAESNVKSLAAPGFTSTRYEGSLSLVQIPTDEDLPRTSEQVGIGLRRERIEQALLPPRPNRTPRAVPERIGEPSLIRHVVYVIKENRTYDQVLGDDPRGNGDPRLCTFGEEFTPNEHAIAREFVLLDNTYCAGILSADGHQWSTTAFSTDYVERSFAGWPRSYPDGMGIDEADALAYSPTGFIWDAALARGLTLRNFGEFTAPMLTWRDGSRRDDIGYSACDRVCRGESDEVVLTSEPMIESIRPFTVKDYVGWDLRVSDRYRADRFLEDLQRCESEGEYPSLVIVCLPNDHTNGAAEGMPTPGSYVADNDLAFGRIVSGLSHSKFFASMAIFAIEDDPQAGWDHVSGYRTTAFVVSPYAKRHAVVSTQYNTTCILRTIEQILGIPPMNQFDASATPMFDCFQDDPDGTAFDFVPNRIPLDRLNAPAHALSDPILRADAFASMAMDFALPDRAPEDELNRILWRAMRGTQEPYPEWAITKLFGDDDDDDDRRESKAK